MLTLQNMTYAHPNKDVLFDNLNLTINRQEKIALIGNNGAGKSTLLKILAGVLQPLSGAVVTGDTPYYIPQLFGQFNDYTLAEALQISGKLKALQEILAGEVTEANMTLLDDDWGIEERSREALAHWGLGDIDLARGMGSLSGGQKTRVFLAGIAIHRPKVVLLDEPSNHLDADSRAQLYDYVRTASATLIVVSHDRTLLNLLDTVYELSGKGITVYGGNYDFYKAQKAIEAQALQDDLKNKEKALRKAREVEREAIERQQKLDARGKKKQEKAGLPTISMNTLRNSAEKSTAKMKDVHAEKTETIARELGEIRKAMPDRDKMRMGFDDSGLHNGKILVLARAVNYGYGDKPLWPQPLSFTLTSGQRMAIKGGNGAGKTTLIRLLLGELQPSAGHLERAEASAIYLDQDYSLIDNSLNVYEQAQGFNTGQWQEHEVKSRLANFLFTRDYWDKACATLSGGEKMRLILCCLTLGNRAPDMIILDEPTNNLDIQNTEILTEAIRDYKGTVIVVSHDAVFLKEIGVSETMTLQGTNPQQ